MQTSMSLKYDPSSEPCTFLYSSPLRFAGRREAVDDNSKVHKKVRSLFFIDNILVRIHFIIVMIRRTGLAVSREAGSRRERSLVDDNWKAHEKVRAPLAPCLSSYTSMRGDI